MDNFFPIQKSTLSTKAIKNYVVQQYNFLEAVECRLFRQTLNDLYLIKHAGKLYIFKVWAASYTNDSVFEEVLRFRQYFQKKSTDS